MAERSKKVDLSAGFPRIGLGYHKAGPLASGPAGSDLFSLCLLFLQQTEQAGRRHGAQQGHVHYTSPFLLLSRMHSRA